ncbi:Uncharacterised protein [Actinobacillus ureae]|uniref:Prepilin-type cleavage/methylation N-terminal domain protein n=1 Tax=Actinobacillus ureae ATCC 25976 TaxID=887324 RepID=E8KK25_9PAST|nr:DUF5374 domain-containing protein [Actinobacillus ureae]EFX90743.1 hypothetical protein HMPREF0027_2192 [Actinobacillus ureae ATCC 25976]SUT87443.1 Uncharacterised protein [Actinobacillus ureae]SUU48860.1 Uncharacterised protein [Actinobacillus ureae]
MNKLIKSESFISILIGIVIFSLIFISASRWGSHQTEKINYIYQQQQALQIIENQLALKYSKQTCEQYVQQNHLKFEIECQANKISVSFPLGKVEITP